MKIVSKIMISCVICILSCIIVGNQAYSKDLREVETITIASEVIDPNKFEPTNPGQSDIKPIMDIGNIIIGAIKVIGVIVLVATLMVIGIKYMTGSVSEKAEYKKTMIPYLVGAFVFLALTQLLAVIIEIAGDIK